MGVTKQSPTAEEYIHGITVGTLIKPPYAYMFHKNPKCKDCYGRGLLIKYIPSTGKRHLHACHCLMQSRRELTEEEIANTEDRTQEETS